MKRALRGWARGVLHRVHAAIPKSDHVVLWGWPDFEDSVVALESGLRVSGRRVVVLLEDASAPTPIELGPRTTRLPKRSIRGLIAFLRASHVFFTHPCYVRRFPDDVVSVNVWHGMPIKTTGLLCAGEEGIDSSHVLATSAFWADIMVRSMSPTTVPLTVGLPRNDRLFGDPGRAWKALGLDERDDIEHLVVWLPTYRRSVRGFRTVDGTPTDSPFELDGVDPDDLDRFLRDHRAYGVVKPHPMAAFSGEQRLENLLLLDSDRLRATGVSLYELLAASEVLVSDMSSVTIDYLLLDRPIIHAMADLERYGDTRGWSVDSVEEVLGGPVVTSYTELTDELAAVFAGEDVGWAARQATRERCHRHLDPGATQRLLAAIGLPGLPPE